MNAGHILYLCCGEEHQRRPQHMYSRMHLRQEHVRPAILHTIYTPQQQPPATASKSKQLSCTHNTSAVALRYSHHPLNMKSFLVVSFYFQVPLGLVVLLYILCVRIEQVFILSLQQQRHSSTQCTAHPWSATTNIRVPSHISLNHVSLSITFVLRSTRCLRT